MFNISTLHSNYHFTLVVRDASCEVDHQRKVWRIAEYIPFWLVCLAAMG